MLSTQGVQRRRETRARDSLACSNGPSWKAVHEARRRRGRWQPIVQLWWHNFGDTRLTYKTVTKQNFDGTCSPLPPLAKRGQKGPSEMHRLLSFAVLVLASASFQCNALSTAAKRKSESLVEMRRRALSQQSRQPHRKENGRSLRQQSPVVPERLTRQFVAEVLNEAMFRQELALDAIEKQRRQRGEDSETMHDTEADSAQRVGDKIERRISELEKVKSQLLGLKLGIGFRGDIHATSVFLEKQQDEQSRVRTTTRLHRRGLILPSGSTDSSWEAKRSQRRCYEASRSREGYVVPS